MIMSILFLLTGIIGILTLVLLIRSYKSNPFCNLYLVLIFSIITIRHLIHGSYFLELQTFLKPDKGPFSTFFLIIVPSFYLYYKYLVFPQKNYHLKDLKHLIYIFFIFLININQDLKSSFHGFFGRLSNFYLVGVFLVFYLVMIFNLLQKNIWFKNNLMLNRQHFHLIKNWTLYLYIMNVLSAIVLMISLYREINQGVLLSGKSMAFFILFFWLFIFFKVLSSPEILYGLPVLNKTLIRFSDLKEVEEQIQIIRGTHWVLETTLIKSDQDQRLQDNIREHIERYIFEVDKLSYDQKIFRNQKATQTEIAEAMGVPTSHIVYLFKYHSKVSFSEYRMNYRIQDAITLIESGFLDNETLESLSNKIGFSSYNPFFTAFRKVTNYAPHEYLKAKKK